MPVIGLMTDFGLEDNFVGVMKGVIYAINPEVEIIDITHNIRTHSIHQAAFLLQTSYHYFPRSTIFLAVVDPTVGTNRKALIVEADGYIFLAPDNGILSFLKQEKIGKIIQITNKKYFLKPVSATFQGRDIFAPVAAHISRGVNVESFGKRIEKMKTIRLPTPLIKGNDLIGEVIYVDRFGNLVSNIGEDLFNEFARGKKFCIMFGEEKISKITRSYTEGRKGSPIAIFDSFGNLEIALYCESASSQLGLKEGDKIIVRRRG